MDLPETEALLSSRQRINSSQAQSWLVAVLYVKTVLIDHSSAELPAKVWWITLTASTEIFVSDVFTEIQ